MQSITECQLDTHGGERWFSIVEGNIADSEADAVVISADAGHWLPPKGAAARAIQAKYGEEVFEHQKQMTSFTPEGFFSLGKPSGGGAYAGISSGPLGQAKGGSQQLLIVRLPGAEWIEDPSAGISTILKAIFAVLGSLSVMQSRRFSSVALSDIAGKRGYPVQARLEAFLGAVANWFAGPCGGDRVELVLFKEGRRPFDERKEEWLQAMRQRFGWDANVADQKDVQQMLRSIRELVSAQLSAGASNPEMQRVLLDLATRLDPGHPRSIQEIAQAGRGLAEVLSAELCRSHDLPFSLNTFDNLQRLENSRHHVAKWIVSYLHTMRTLGNEASHVVEKEGEPERCPARLEKDDLLVLLAHIRRVINFRTRWLQSGLGMPQSKT